MLTEGWVEVEKPPTLVPRERWSGNAFSEGRKEDDGGTEMECGGGRWVRRHSSGDGSGDAAPEMELGDAAQETECGGV